MKIKSLALMAVLVLTNLFLMTHRVSACACCSDDGEYRLGFHRPSEYQLSQLQEIRFGKTAHLIETQANADEEIKSPSHQADSYSVSGSFNGSFWRLAFRDGNESGTLSLPVPIKMWSYAVDTHDGQKSPGGGPMLYKEWRFEGLVSGTGFFKKGIIAPTKFFLVFQGRGNRCEDAGSFSHWRLEIFGRKARYAFYGELAEASNAARNSPQPNTFGMSATSQSPIVTEPGGAGVSGSRHLLLFLMTTRMDSSSTLSWKERTVS